MHGCEAGHDYIYHGALNIYKARELLKVVEAWKCRRCGDIRVGTRGPEVLTSTEGMLPQTAEGKHWLLFVCKAGEEPVYQLLQASDTQYLEHNCPGQPAGERLYYVRGKGVFYGLDGPPAGMHYVYELEKTLRGYIDLARTPPEVVTLIR
ncbi:MAG: hypothetical protein QXH12_01165 [Candidatus Caldarchaeum sp.]|uniref:Uncharacterized protein n=1 Tax=Caldiarchaeum subterraneum TaxID=311458 RepID=A0A7C5L771_CALS0